MGVNKGSWFSVNFRTDVFKYLSKDKGSEHPHSTGRLYTLDEFDSAYFPTDWYRLHDRLGDGCEIEFPVCMVSKVKWSPTFYCRDDNSGRVTPKKKYFEEVCTVWILKRRC